MSCHARCEYAHMVGMIEHRCHPNCYLGIHMSHNGLNKFFKPGLDAKIQFLNVENRMPPNYFKNYNLIDVIGSEPVRKTFLNVYDPDKGMKIAAFGKKALDLILAEIQRHEEAERLVASQAAAARRFKQSKLIWRKR